MKASHKSTLIKFAILIPCFSFCLTLTGCTVKIANAVDKALTFRDWQMYSSDIKYWRFDGEKGRIREDRQGTYDLMIADDNSYIRYTIDYGSDEYLGSVRVKSFDSDLKPYVEFLQWSSKDLDERNKTMAELDSRPELKSHNFTVVNEKDTNEPLLIVSRDQGFYFKPWLYAMTRLEVSKVILMSYQIKADNSKGVKNKTDYDEVGL